MQLTKIKLSGFKSFVDPTVVPMPSQLVGIVGPNGCGKSNVIDAVRWVMGESSAKTLRGDSMTDVIFNGSTERMPVGQASVELIFDNKDGTAPGEYAKYSEIAIRREVTRDSISTYYLNGTKCRRKDIADIFLGTGLGPRSYSIIQQGTVSRLIEAKPEELRVYLEEAAGISKYKERRRETENRIRHTRENLERLTDLRLEIEKQLAHLKRQANAAERFKVLKEEQRQSKADLYALRYQQLGDDMKDLSEAVAKGETELEAKTAELRRVESQIEAYREQHVEVTETFNDVHSRYYTIGGEVSRIEQAMKYQKERQEQLELDFEQAASNWQTLQTTLDEDQATISSVLRDLDIIKPEHETAQQEAEHSQTTLQEKETAMQHWQEEWDAFNVKAASTSKAVEVEQTRVQHINDRITQIIAREEKLSAQLSELTVSAFEEDQVNCDAAIEALKKTLEDIAEEERSAKATLAQTKEHLQTFSKQLDEKKSELQQLVGKQASLEALQRAALSSEDEAANAWLKSSGYDQQPRVAQQLSVDSGWEKAVETVLGDYLQAVCMEDTLESISSQLEANTGLTFAWTKTVSAKPSTLAEKMSGKAPFAWLNDVYVVEHIDEAIAKRDALAPHESVITKDGIWLSQQWLRMPGEQDAQSGVIARERELRELEKGIDTLKQTIESLEEQYHSSESTLSQWTTTCEQLQERLSEQQSQLSKREAEKLLIEGKIEQVKKEQTTLGRDIAQLQEEQSSLKENLAEAKAALETAARAMEDDTAARDAMQARRDEAQSQLYDAREAAKTKKENAHALAMKYHALETQAESLKQNLSRMQEQLTMLTDRKQQLESAVTDSVKPYEELQAQLEEHLEKRLTVEKELNDARLKVTEVDQALKDSEASRHSADDAVQQVRQSLEQSRLDIQSFTVRQQTIDEQMVELGFAIKEVLEGMEEPKPIPELESHLEHLQRRIERLGAINLAAIDEYKEKEERKTYLDAQNDDLEEALTTLENAIAKIDKETRTKFKETFDFVNTTFQKIFPKIFGGGSATLELTGNDLLDTGVTVMARPPGKRNSTIHLLSGGEKALTAISLVFSIFQLTPAPFCMLDEVDAPLDDANVMRFCEIVKEMSQKVQFIVITHNKVTMEMAQQLMGVTMHEPGVSRLVSVDVDEAASMVEA